MVTMAVVEVIAGVLSNLNSNYEKKYCFASS